MGAMEWFKVALIVQLFFGAFLTMTVHGLSNAPGFNDNDVAAFNIVNSDFNTERVAGTLGTNAEKQFQLGAQDLGSLAYFSGNILVDFVVNAFAAIPLMFGLLVQAIAYFITLDPVISQQLSLFVTVIVGALYVIGFMQLLIGVRSGRLVG